MSFVLKIPKKFLKIISFGIVGGIFYSIVHFIWQHVHDLKNHPLHFDYFSLILSIALSLAAVFNYALIWQLITEKVGCAICREKGIISWFYSEIGKYLPGKIFLLVGKFYFYHQERKSLKQVTLCFYLETVCTLLGASWVGAVSVLLGDFDFLKTYQFFLYPIIVFFLAALHPKAIEFFWNAAARILKKDPVVISLRYLEVLTITALYAGNFLIFGISFYFLVNGIYPIPLGSVFFLTGSFALATVAGMVSFVAPSGLGVREGVLVLALRNVLPGAVAGIISLAARLWAIGAELFLILLTFIYAKSRGIQFQPPKKLAEELARLNQ